MIKHIVMWELKDFAEGGTRDENAKKIKERLEALKGVVKELRDIEVGINFEKSDMAYDLVLCSVFEDEAGLEIYQRHPEHLKVVDFIGKVKDKRIVVDYRV